MNWKTRESGGELIAGRYVLDRTLGAGGFGVVYQAFDEERNEQVALKVLQHAEGDWLLRFKREFRLIADIRHPNLVRLYDLAESDGTWFFTMELIEGSDLMTWVWGGRRPTLPAPSTGSIAQHAPGGPMGGDDRADGLVASEAPTIRVGPRDWGRIRDAFGQVAAGVDALHRGGRLHRDIKPSNVMVDESGRVVLLDFGLVRDLTAHSHSTKMVGTVAYMAPEQAAQSKVSEAADWYAVGSMLFEAIAGERPFRGTPLQMMYTKAKHPAPELDSDTSGAPADLVTVCNSLMTTDPAKRSGWKELLGLAPPERGSSLHESSPVGRAPDTLFVGRTTELSELRETLRETRTDGQKTVHVSGTSGIGKSTLVDRFVETLHPKTVVLRGRCYERESVPFKALDSVVDALALHLSRMGDTDVAGLLPRDVRALARLFPVLEKVEAICEAPARAGGIPSQQELRRRATLAFRELLSRIADRAPLVLTIDDLQWGDRDSAALLTELLRPPDAPALMLLTTWRPNEMAHGSMADFAQRIPAVTLSLPPLAADESAAFARSIIGHNEGVITSIVREAKGNPFFVNELARFSAGAGLEPATSDGGVALSEVLMSRVEALAEKQRRLFELIVVSAGPVERSVLLSAVESSEGAAPLLDALCTVQLVRRTPGPEGRELLTVYHDRVREIVAENLPHDVAAACHEGLAAALTRRGDADPEALLAHFLGAGKRERAGVVALEAAKRAFLALAFDHAAELYRTAVETADLSQTEKCLVQEQLGEALANAGRPPEAAEALLKAAHLAQPGDAPELKRRAAHQYLIGGHVDDGLAILEQVLTEHSIALPRSPRQILAALLFRRFQLWRRGLGFRERREAEIDKALLARVDCCWSAAGGLAMTDHLRGSVLQVQHLLLALEAGEPGRIVRGLSLEVAFLSSAGGARSRGRTEDLLETARRLCEKTDNPLAPGWTKLAAGASAFCQGRWAESSKFCRQAVETLSGCVGTTWELDTARTFDEWAMHYRGQFRRLASRIPERLRDARARGDLWAATDLASAFGVVAFLVPDDTARAHAELIRAREGWTARGFQLQHYHLLLGACYVDFYLGNGRLVHERLEETWPAIRRAMLLRPQVVRVELLFLRAAGAACAAQTVGNRDRKRLLSSAKRDARSLQKEDIGFAVPLGQTIQAAIDAANRDTQSAVDHLKRAQSTFVAEGMPLYAAAIAYQRGHLLGNADGEALKEAAWREFEAEGVKRPDRMANMLAPGFQEAPVSECTAAGSIEAADIYPPGSE